MRREMKANESQCGVNEMKYVKWLADINIEASMASNG